MQLTESQDYENILLHSSGLLDVRAPIEFAQGAFPAAENFPLLNNEERHHVGLCYKQKGKEQAIDAGHHLVSGELRQERVSRWVEFTRQHENAYLYCFRGGLRSRISQQWLHEAGVDITRVQGGYKALRQFLITELDNAPKHFTFSLVGGLTGCRKTELIQELDNGIDLEGAAYHRGSSFGAHALPQSSQINFENKVSIDLLRAHKLNQKILSLEDEGRFIGSVDIPKSLFTQMRVSPLVIIERSFEHRLQQLLQEYVINMEQEFLNLHENREIAFKEFSRYLTDSLLRIQKRLGIRRWTILHNCMQDALQAHEKGGEPSAHLSWLGPLVREYYDPMYTSQIDKRRGTIVFKGNYNDCRQFLIDQSSNARE